MPSKQMTVYEFGQKLIETKDLDPVYVLVHATKMTPKQLRAWLLAYWCFYDVGTACKITDGISLKPSGEDDYWRRMVEAAGSTDYPRATERRHFRGDNALKSVSFLKKKGLALLFAPFDDPPRSGLSLHQAMTYVQSWVGFGPWIAFKVADMVERLGLCKVDFSEAPQYLYSSPLETAQQWWREEHPGQGRRSTDKNEGKWAMDRIVARLDENGDMDNGPAGAPPRYERRVNYQEAETVLCKWGSYLKGKYHVGEDVEACRKALVRFPKSPLAIKMALAGKGVLW